MTQETKHSPLPWKTRISCSKKFTREHIKIYAKEASEIADILVISEESRANAELVVRAVNSHYQLVDLLGRVLKFAHITTYDAKAELHPDFLDEVREALKQAKGE